MLKRLTREVKRFEDPRPGISATPQENNMMLWNAVISGFFSHVDCSPEDTPWDGGAFKLTVVIPADYPFKPPIVRFVSRMFHPNIYANGRICMDILQNAWNPAFHLDVVLISIQSLLCDPNLDVPANSKAAQMFNENKRLYNRKVREIVEESRKADGPCGA